jgi:hypothetical protein
LNLRVVNRGFVYGCAAAILFILAKVAKYGVSANSEAPIYILVIATGGVAGGLFWHLGRALLCGDRQRHGHKSKDQDQSN